MRKYLRIRTHTYPIRDEIINGEIIHIVDMDILNNPKKSIRVVRILNPN